MSATTNDHFRLTSLVMVTTLTPGVLIAMCSHVVYHSFRLTVNALSTNHLKFSEKMVFIHCMLLLSLLLSHMLTAMCPSCEFCQPKAHVLIQLCYCQPLRPNDSPTPSVQVWTPAPGSALRPPSCITYPGWPRPPAAPHPHLLHCHISRCTFLSRLKCVLQI